MKKILIVLFLLNSIIGYSQKYSIEKLISDFASGKLFIINDLAISETDSIFFQKISEIEILEYKEIDSVNGKIKYGTLGERGVFKLTIVDTSNLKNLNVGLLDSSILKYFIMENEVFYMTDGAPNSNIYYALNMLINKTIEKVTVLDKYQSVAIWGTEAENGAIQINCDRGKELKL